MKITEIPIVPTLNPLIDGDPVVYGAGFAAGKGNPVEHSLGNVKKYLDSVLDIFHSHTYYKLYLNGVGNYRDTTATIQKYKGNRDSSHKPEFYHEIREYMVDTWGAELVDGRESDDALGCWQWSCKDKSTVIVSIDKDLNQIPGYHYNPRKRQFYYVTKHAADTFFWEQMLQGDATDNIPGIKGVGPKTIERMVERCGGDLVKLRAEVERLYQQQYKDQWQVAMKEVGDLLWMQREEGKSWNQSV